MMNNRYPNIIESYENGGYCFPTLSRFLSQVISKEKFNQAKKEVIQMKGNFLDVVNKFLSRNHDEEIINATQYWKYSVYNRLLQLPIGSSVRFN